jgi:hypothetical protein
MYQSLLAPNGLSGLIAVTSYRVRGEVPLICGIGHEACSKARESNAAQAGAHLGQRYAYIRRSDPMGFDHATKMCPKRALNKPRRKSRY